MPSKKRRRLGRVGATGDEAATFSGPHAVWMPEIVEHIASFLPPNEVACGLRLVDKRTAAQFRSRATVNLAQSVPPAAFRQLTSASCRRLSLRQRQKLLKLAAASSDVAGLAAAVAAVGCPAPHSLLDAASEAGALACCRYITETLGIGWDHWNKTRCLVRAAGKAGLPAVFDGTLQGLVEDSAEGGAAAAAGAGGAAGDEDLTAWLVSELLSNPRRSAWGAEWKNADLAKWAAYGCDLAGLQRLQPHLQQLSPEELGHAVRSAIGSPQPDWRAKCAWLMQLGADPAGAYRAAAELPCDLALERCVWLKSVGLELTSGDLHVNCYQTAAGPILRWLLADGITLTPRGASSLAAKTQDADAVLVLAQLAGDELVGHHFGYMAVENAAKNGYLAALRHMVETYGAEAFSLPDLLRPAVRSGSPGLIAWMLQQPSVSGWSQGGDWAWAEAAAAGCEAALEVLEETACPRPTDGEPYKRAACNGDLRTLAVLRRLGVSYGLPEGAMFTRAICWAPLPALRWLVEEGGCPVDWQAAEKEARTHLSRNRPEVVEWIARTRRARRREGLRPRRQR